MPDHARPQSFEERISEDGCDGEDTKQEDVQSKNHDGNPVQPAPVVWQVVQKNADHSRSHVDAEPRRRKVEDIAPPTLSVPLRQRVHQHGDVVVRMIGWQPSVAPVATFHRALQVHGRRIHDKRAVKKSGCAISGYSFAGIKDMSDDADRVGYVRRKAINRSYMRGSTPGFAT